MWSAVKMIGFGAGQMAIATLTFLLLYLVFVPITMDLLMVTWLWQQCLGGERRWRSALHRWSGVTQRGPG